MKDAYYFPHFSNARNDRKIKRLRKTLGIEGYGIYFMILEILRDQSDFRYPIQDIDLLADEFDTSVEKVKAVIVNFELFDIDDDMFFSTNLIKFLEPYMKMKEQRRIAGIASGQARKNKDERPFNDRSTTVQRMLNENEQSKVKESKEKESKGKYSLVVYSPDFERVWELYERRGSKAEAYKQWKLLTPQDRKLVVDHIPRYLDSVTEPRYQKHFERYIKQRHFESEPPPKHNIFSGGI